MILCIILVDIEEKGVKNMKEREIKMDKKKDMQISAITIARYIVAFCAGQVVPVALTNIKLQKLLYLVFGEYYLDHGKPLFRETFEAWQYGPVVASVYDEFCAFAGSYILLSESDLGLPDNVKLDIDPIIKTNMKRDVFDLVDDTHQPGSAWAKAVARNNGTIKDHPEILIEDIIEEFRKRRGKCGEDSTGR